MRYLSFALLLWIACHMGAGVTPPPPPTTTTIAPPPIAHHPLPTGRVLVVVSLTGATGESSNMGGEHYILRGEIDGAPVVLHAGGHGVSLGLYDDQGEVQLGRWFLAEAYLGESPEHLQELAIACNAWGACIREHLDGEVIAMLPTVDADEAEGLRAMRGAIGSSELGPLAARACVIGDAPFSGRCPMPRAPRGR